MNKYKQYIDNNEYEFIPYSKNEFSNGGINYDNPNASLEKKEIFMTPNGSVNGVNTGTHESGNDADINIPNGTMILSDRLKLGKKTFAELGAKYKTDKEDKIIEDIKATDSIKSTAKLILDIKQKKMNELFSAQESLKQSKVAAYAKKIGVALPQQHQMPNGQMMNNSDMQYKNGGMKHYQHGGYSTPTGTYDENGNLIKGGYNGVDIYGQPIFEDNNQSIPMITNQNIENRYNENIVNNSTNKQINNPEYNPYIEPKKSYNNDYSQYADVVAGIANSAGAIYGLATNKKPTPINYQNPNVKYLDPSAALRDADIQNKVSRNSLKDMTGGNSGAYLNAATQVGAQNTLNKAKIRNTYENQNSALYNRNQEIVADNANKSMDATAADIANYRNLNTKYVGDLGVNAAGMFKDNKSASQDYKTLGMISSMYPNFKYDRRSGEWKNKNGVKLTQEEINKIYK